MATFCSGHWVHTDALGLFIHGKSWQLFTPVLVCTKSNTCHCTVGDPLSLVFSFKMHLKVRNFDLENASVWIEAPFWPQDLHRLRGSSCYTSRGVLWWPMIRSRITPWVIPSQLQNKQIESSKILMRIFMSTKWQKRIFFLKEAKWLAGFPVWYPICYGLAASPAQKPVKSMKNAMFSCNQMARQWRYSKVTVMPYLISTIGMTSWQASKLHKLVVLIDASCFPGSWKTSVLYVEIIPDLTAMLVMMRMTGIPTKYGGIVSLLTG